MKGIISYSIDTKLLEELDFFREDVPRSRFITKLLEIALEKIRKEMKREKTIRVDSDSLAATDQQVSIIKGVD